MKRKIIQLILCCMLMTSVGCSKFLDEKSKSSLAIPKTVRDLQALMDYELYTIRSFPVGMDVASDYYFMGDDDIKSLSTELNNMYLLNNESAESSDWTECYTKIMYANIVLGNIDEADLDGLSITDRDRAKGIALFHRAWNFFWLAQEFSPAYDANTAKNELGIPLRTTSDINIGFRRASLEDTFAQIVNDLREAALLLPDLPLKKTRPSKAAVYAVLARVYLYMCDVDEALRYATLCLQLQGDLMDYNLISPTSTIPFELMNREVIFHCSLASSGIIFGGTGSYADTILMKEYGEEDLRRPLYYKQNANGWYNFRGNYAGPVGTSEFCGIATDEIYLIKAECEARTNKITEAQTTIQLLLRSRFELNRMPIIPMVKEQLLSFILLERQKELAFRFGIRWSDIKRLNKHYHAGIVIKRIFEGKQYFLEPNDKRYAILIPPTIVAAGGLIQNPR